MVVSAEAREELVLRRLRDRYERAGYSFHAHPPRELLPSFLDKYRPDAIALKDDGGVVVEIRMPHTQSEVRLSEIARLFADQRNWRFEIVSLDEVGEIQDIQSSSRSLIEDELTRVEQLAEQGHHRAAFATGWATLEAAARTLLAGADEGRLILRYPTQIAETLARYGFIDQQTAKVLAGLVQVRNSVVHGNLAYKIDGQAVSSLIRITRGLVSQIHEEPRLSPRH